MGIRLWLERLAVGVNSLAELLRQNVIRGRDKNAEENVCNWLQIAAGYALLD